MSARRPEAGAASTMARVERDLAASTQAYATAAEEIAHLQRLLEKAIQNALLVLEHRHPSIAQLLLESIGDRPRAARWMCMHQRALGGKSACEALADGDEDAVWELVAGLGGVEAGSGSIRTPMAY